VKGFAPAELSYAGLFSSYKDATPTELSLLVTKVTPLRGFVTLGLCLFTKVQLLRSQSWLLSLSVVVIQK